MPRPKLDRPNFRLKRHDNGIWYVHWTVPGGEPQHRSTRSRDEDEARRQLKEVENAWEQPLPPAGPTIGDILDGYLAERSEHVVDSERLRYAALAVARHVGAIRPADLARITYRNARRREGVGDGTIGKEVRTLRAALRWAVNEKWIAAAPHVEAPPKPAPRDRFLSRAEAEALVTACAAPHLHLAVLTALHTAARMGAILDLSWERVDLEGRLIHFRLPGRSETKKRRATVPINRTLLVALQEARLVAVTERVIEYKGQPVRSIRHAFENAIRRSGIAYCTRHDLRRTAASWMVMAGVPMKQVAAMLGDTEAMVEKVYGRFSPDWLREAAAALEGDTRPRVAAVRDGLKKAIS